MKTQEAVMRKIKSLCCEYRISMNRLAYLAGVPPSTIKNIMYGNSENTGIVTIAKICNGLEISIQDFFNDDLFCGLEQELE